MCLPAWYHPIAIVLLVVFNNIADAEYEGNLCNHTSKSTPGICKKLDQCLSAIQDLRLGVYPQNCGFIGTIPIVCCTPHPEAATTIVTATAATTTTTPPPPPTTTATTTPPPTTVATPPSLTTTITAATTTTVPPPPPTTTAAAATTTTPAVTTIPPPPPTTTTTTTPPPPTTTTAATTTTKKFGIDQIQVGEKSRLACESYKMLAYKKANSTFGDESELIENCPWQHKSVAVAVEGRVAQEAEFPHMVLIAYGKRLTKYNLACGGSLISDKFVLTAAHCLVGTLYPPIAVRIGDLDFSDSEDDQYVQQISIKDYFLSPFYNAIIKINDIALVELEHSAQLSLHVKPICLYRWDPAIKVRSAMLVGWGSTGQVKDHNKLFKGVVQYFSPEDCRKIYTSFQEPILIVPGKHICFGRREEKHANTCRGDSGVPLQIYNKDVYCSYYAFAVASFGRTDCGGVGVPSGYTNIYPHLEWIEGIVWP